MHIKTFIAAAVVALTAACAQEAPETEATETVVVPADETIELNDDGSVKTEATPAAN